LRSRGSRGSERLKITDANYGIQRLLEDLGKQVLEREINRKRRKEREMNRKRQKERERDKQKGTERERER
jgi:hypothetical protein